MYETRHSLFERLSFFALALTAIALPVFVIPFPGSVPEFWKIFLVSFGTLFALILWLFSRLETGVIVLPRSPIYFAAIAVLAVTALSSAFSGSFIKSFFGTGTDPDAGVFTFGLFAAFSLSSLVFRKKTALAFYFFFFVSVCALFLSQIFFSFSDGQFNPFSFLASRIDNLFGKWSDLGILAGLGAVLPVVLWSEYRGALPRTFLAALFLLSLFFSIIALPKPYWFFLILFGLVLSAREYFIRRSAEGPPARTSVLPGVFLAISLVFLFAGNAIGGKILETMKVPRVIEVRPTASETFAVMRGTFGEGAKSIFLGAGPNRFGAKWQLHRGLPSSQVIPAETTFIYGFGAIPSSLVTTGLAGFLSWVFFLLLIVLTGARSFAKGEVQPVTLAAWVGAAYLFGAACLSVPSAALLFLAFFFSGMFFGLLADERIITTRQINILSDRERGFFMVALLTGAILLTLVLGYALISKYRAFFAFREAALSAHARDLDRAEASLLRATSLSKEDLFYRHLSELYLARMQTLLSSPTDNPDELRANFQSLFQSSLSNAKLATETDPGNYLNWISYGNVFAFIVPLNIPGLETAYDTAKEAYARALSQNPLAPNLYLSLARLDLTAGKKDTAKEFIDKAVAAKSNFTEAFVLLSRIEESEGNRRDAIAALKRAIEGEPANPSLLFQLGFLSYSTEEYDTAKAALEKAVALVPQYANAKYFLGLTYSFLGRTEDAVLQFEAILALNPDNAEVAHILANLRAGREPFESAASERVSSVEPRFETEAAGEEGSQE